MTQDEISALLGRSLTANEIQNFDLYLDIATESIEDLLCLELCGGTSAKTFTPRKGYSTIWTGIYTDVISVKVNGEEVEYSKAQHDKKEARWYDSIILEEETEDDVVIEAEWGFDPIPADLQKLIALQFVEAQKLYQDANVKSKKVEDFSITFGDLTEDEEFMRSNARVIRKYSLCNMGSIQHGDVCDDFRRFY